MPQKLNVFLDLLSEWLLPCESMLDHYFLSTYLKIMFPNQIWNLPRNLSVSSTVSSSENGEGNGNPLQYSCLENPVDRGAWWTAVHGVTQSWTRLKWLSMHACIGEGNGNPLQYSCLENPRDRGAWWAAIYGVTQSWLWLKQLSSSSCSSKNASLFLS